MKAKTSIKRLLRSGYGVTFHNKLWITPEDGSYLVGNDEVYERQPQAGKERPDEGEGDQEQPQPKRLHAADLVTFACRREAIKYFMQRRRDLLPALTGDQAKGKDTKKQEKEKEKKKSKAKK